jgi:hypothetical protein
VATAARHRSAELARSIRPSLASRKSTRAYRRSSGEAV